MESGGWRGNKVTMGREDGASADGRIVGKVVTSTGDMLFPASTTPVNPSLMAAVVRLMAAAETATFGGNRAGGRGSSEARGGDSYGQTLGKSQRPNPLLCFHCQEEGHIRP